MTSDCSPTVRQLLATPAQRYAHPGAAPSPIETPPVLRRHFSVAVEALTLQAPAWRDYVGRSLDVPLSRTQVAAGFHGEIATHVLSDMVFMDIRSDAVAQVRSAARIGTDTLDDYVFHVAVEGLIESVAEGHRPRRSTQFVPGVLALDMRQPWLSPDGIRQQFRLPRATLYRPFEPEGGLAAYIRNCRLREAAEELLSAPHRPVIDIAYGLSFNSASDFTRALRRAYDMPPQDFRAMGLAAAKAR